MMKLPISYNIRNLVVRKVTTSLTVLGIGLVVSVFLCMMALAEGLASVFQSSGQSYNLVLLRKNAQAELQSMVTREQVTLLKAIEGVDVLPDGRTLLSPELVMIINPEKYEGGTANVTMRGVHALAIEMRPKMRIIEGRMFTPGLSEVIVSEGISKRFIGCALGDTLVYGSIRWKVVGIFKAEGTAPDSEIWADLDYNMNAFNRNVYQSVLLQSKNPAARARVIKQIESDPRLLFEVKTEKEYYDSQTQSAEPIKFLGFFIGLIMAVGACFGAMNTMYAAVSSRTREIATLRVLGFSRSVILISFVLESVFLGLLGGIVGCFLGFMAIKLAFSGVTGTMNFATFSEVVFHFKMTPGLMFSGIVFSMFMGFLGGLLPATKAAYTKITIALRQVG